MTRKKVWRFTCEFCGKSGCSGGHISAHEKHCTLNPKRECRMCKILRLETRSVAENAMAILRYGVEAVQKSVICPACILAAVRRVNGSEEDIEPVMFDYKAACVEFFELRDGMANAVHDGIDWRPEHSTPEDHHA